MLADLLWQVSEPAGAVREPLDYSGAPLAVLVGVATCSSHVLDACCPDDAAPLHSRPLPLPDPTCRSGEITSSRTRGPGPR